MNAHILATVAGMPNPTRQWVTLLAMKQAENVVEIRPAQFLLDNGIEFNWSPLPKRLRQRQPKQCYHNALALAVRGRGRYVYVEGVATNIIPVDHAWCYDRATGRIVDNTWSEGTAYLGIPFRTAYVRACLWRERVALMNIEDGYPVITGEHPRDQWYEPLTP